jgi:hypothetical protein
MAPTARAAVPAGDVATGYVALCLRLRRLVPELVDAGAADPALLRAAAAEPLPTPAALVRDAGRLAEVLPDAGLDPQRAQFLRAQLRAVEWRARRLAGQRVSFGREVRECLDVDLDVDAVRGEPDAYRAAHRELATLLPGRGALPDRMAAYRRADVVPAARLGAAIRTLMTELRGRVAARYGLPPTETVVPLLVDNGPWSALHSARCGRRAVVRFNTGAGPTAARLPRLVAHETYPGHHTECVRAGLAAAGGRVELAVAVIGSPQTVLSEGLAECALDTAVGPTWGGWAAAVLGTAGVLLDGERAERLDAVRAALQRVRLDAALLLHGEGPPTGASAAAAEEHLRRWLLLDAARARRVRDALARPMWRTQVVASVEGVRLMRRWLGQRGVDPVGQHLRLLDDPLTPTALRVRTSTESLSGRDGR